MKTSTIARLDTRSASLLSLPFLIVLAAFSGTADARSCGMTRPPAFALPPVGAMHHPMYHPMYQGVQHKGRSLRAGNPWPSVIDVARQSGEFATLLTAVETAGLTALLEGTGPFTLFAPTEAAFADLPEGALEELLGDKEKLTALLKYHLVPGRVKATDILTNPTLKTASGQDLPTPDLGVVRADVRARNGIVHVVSKVLLPVD